MSNNNLYQHKYRIQSTRLPCKDYSDDGKYFVTICTKDKQIFFGKVVNGEMVLNDIGKVVNKFWLEIPKHFKGVRLGEYIIMPNHLHGIVIIEFNYQNWIKGDIENVNMIGKIDNRYGICQPVVETQHCCVSTNAK